jgi:hypothetical protein
MFYFPSNFLFTSETFLPLTTNLRCSSFLKRVYFLRVSSSLQLAKVLLTIIFLSPCFLLLLSHYSTYVTSCLLPCIRFFLSLALFHSVLFRIGGYSRNQFSCLHWLLSLSKNILTATPYTRISCGTTEGTYEDPSSSIRIYDTIHGYTDPTTDLPSTRRIHPYLAL